MFNCNINLFMNKKIITGFLMFALAVFSMSSFVACKDIDEDSYDDLKARINKEKTLREAIEKQIEELQKAIDTYKCKCDPSKYASKDEFDKAMKKLNDLQNTVDSLKKVPGGGGRVDTIYIQEPYNDEWIKLGFKDVKDSLRILNALNAWAVHLHQTDSIRIDSLVNAIYGWDETLKNLNFRVDSIIKNMTRDTIYISGGCDSLCKAKIAEAKATADSALKLSEKALLLAQENSNRIDSLEQRVSEIVKLIKQEVSLLNSRIDLLLDNMVTGVIIQGTESPVIGYFNTPLDVRSQMLAAYYGEVTNNVKFPSVKTGDYVDASEFWTERNVEVMGINPANAEGKVSLNSGEQFVGQKNGKETGNAGTLYLTVNPTSVNFEGKTLTLESSKGEAAGIELEALKKSDRELTFGFTRANNGFYEAEATLKAENIDKAKVRVDYKNLESAAKDMLKEKTKSSVLGFGAALLSSMKDVMPAYAVKASWTSPKNTYNYTQKDYDVYSQYGLAATAIKPFSYAFLKDLNVNLPGEQKIINLLDQIIDKINIQIDLNLPDFSKYQGSITFKDITLPTIDDNTFRITYTKTYTAEDLAGEGKLWEDDEKTQLYFLVTNKEHSRYAIVAVDDAGNNVLYIKNSDSESWHVATTDEASSFGAIEFGLTVDVDINKTPEIKKTLQDIIDDLNKNYGANSDLAKTITDLLNDVASLGNIDTKINEAISNAKDDLKSQLNSYVTKAYNKLNNFFSKAPNKALQPILIGKSNGKIGILSKSKKNPTKVSGTSLELVPTSYTLELFAPAYKKFVAVTDVWDAKGNPAAASIGKAANGDNMLKVIDSEKTCTMNGQAGYTYEVAYSAIDYHGKVVIKRFYVKF